LDTKLGLFWGDIFVIQVRKNINRIKRASRNKNEQVKLDTMNPTFKMNIISQPQSSPFQLNPLQDLIPTSLKSRSYI
jgi:hypothetical protein